MLIYSYAISCSTLSLPHFRLLNLCNNDETAEDNLYNNNPTTNNNDNTTTQKQEAAKYRVQTERESYPATLFNMLISDIGPPWLIENLTRKLRFKEGVRSPDVKIGSSSGSSERKKKRRGKRDRESLLGREGMAAASSSSSSNNRLHRELVLHIVGASVDSELWGWDGTTTKSYTHKEMLDAYAEASTNVLSYLKNFIDTIDSLRLVFVGPDCPKPKRSESGGGGEGGGKDDETIVCRLDKTIPGSNTMLNIETHCCNYGEDDTKLPCPDAIIFFNPGLSCPDYDWSKALSAASSYQSSTPFLITTNTEMEGFADIKCLVDGGYVDSKELPKYVLETIDVDVETTPSNNSRYDEEDEQNKRFFFCENPYAGLRVRQSGTMANDLYVKSRWVMGGLFQLGGGDGNVEKEKKKAKVVDKSKEKKKRKESEDNGSARKKRRKVGSNPALI